MGSLLYAPFVLARSLIRADGESRTPYQTVLSALFRQIFIGWLNKRISFEVKIVEAYSKTVQPHHQPDPPGKGRHAGRIHQLTIDAYIDAACAPSRQDLHFKPVRSSRWVETSGFFPAVAQ